MSSAQTHRQSWPIVRALCDIRRTPRARTRSSPFRAWRGRAPLKCRSSLNKRDFQLFKHFIRKNNLKRLTCRIIIIVVDINMTSTQGGVSREHYLTTTTQLSKASNCLLSGVAIIFGNPSRRHQFSWPSTATFYFSRVALARAFSAKMSSPATKYGHTPIVELPIATACGSGG
jgi:hypothetical protein